MLSSPLKHHTANKKLMIINVYNYLPGTNSVGKSHQTLTLRKRVAEVLGVAERTVASVVSDWNKRMDGTFTPQKVLGRPKFLLTKMLQNSCAHEDFECHTSILCQFEYSSRCV
jgi:hypothetical protein